MKYIWITMLATAFVFASCGDKKEGEKETKKENTVPNVPTVKTGLKIAWYSIDSLNENYHHFKDVEKSTKAKEKAFERQLEEKQKSLEQYVYNNEERAKSGQLSENQIAMVQQEIQSRQAALYQYQQTEGARLEKEVAEQMEVLNNRVQAAGKKYCEKHGIDLLMAHGKGAGQINFINPEMDVTKEFIAFLNEYQAEIERDLGVSKKKK